MSRAIRRVPPDWVHPKDHRGHYIRMYDLDYETALETYRQEEAEFDADKVGMTFEEYDGPPPRREDYRPKWESEPTHYQIYEDVSEGTPVSPIFASKEVMKEWLLEQGYSEKASSRFIEVEWAPSMVFTPEKGLSGIGIHSLDH